MKFIKKVIKKLIGKRKYYKWLTLNRIHFMHYPSKNFTDLCKGIDVDIPHKDVFLYYRFIEKPELRPKEFRNQNPTRRINRLIERFIKALTKVFA